MPTDTTVLATALRQVADLLEQVHDAEAGRPTPCEGWTVGDLADHVVLGIGRFAAGVRGEEVDWSAPTPHVDGDRAAAARAAGQDLLDAWAGSGGTDAPPVEWQCAELAVHTWDLATALGRDTAALDPAVAEAGASFMRQGLTDDNRAPAFGPPRPEPEGADAYTRLAAFAGREV